MIWLDDRIGDAAPSVREQARRFVPYALSISKRARAVVDGAGQAETVFDQRFLCAKANVVTPRKLQDGHAASRR